MTKKSLLALTFVAFAACQQSAKTENTDEIKTEKLQTDDCQTLLKVLARQSGLNLKPYETFYTRIESVSNDEVTIQVFVENEVENEQKNESTIAWLRLVPSEKLLLDVTADPENPKKMHLEPTLFDQLVKVCQIEIPKKPENEDDGMTSREDAILNNLSIHEAYSLFIVSKEFEDAKLLLPYLPKNDTIVKVGENGLIDIEYKMPKDAIFMTLNYEGGVTEINFQQDGKNVRRQIVLSAD